MSMEENSLKGGKVRTRNIELTDELMRKENLSRLISAMHVIEETFGKNWIEQNLQPDWGKQEEFRPYDVNFEFLTKGEKVHPLKLNWMKGNLQSMVRVISLGEYVTILKAVPNFDDKIKELKNKEDFNSIYFELKVASLFKKKECFISFIKRRRDGAKTPEFSVKYNGIEFFVECKKKAPLTERENQIQRIYNEIASKILTLMREYKINLKVDLEFLTSPKDEDEETVLKELFQHIKDNVQGNVLISDLCEVNISKLLSFDYATPFIPVLSPKDFDTNWSYTVVSFEANEAGKRIAVEGYETADLHTLAVAQSKNFGLVRFKAPSDPTIEKGIIISTLRSIRRDALPKFKEYSPGIIYLEMDKSRYDRLNQRNLLNKLENEINSQIFENEPNVWGVLLTTEIYLEQEPYYTLQTPARFIQNSHAQVPSDIPKIVFDSYDDVNC
ncbi:MAG: hypothetical protein ACTSX0_11460 [Promethearchaeota archaeon]